MRGAFVLLGGVALCLAAQGACDEADKNDQWRRNSLLVKNLDDFNSMMPTSTWDSRIRSKRFVGVLSSALIYYSISNLPDKLDRVREAVNKTKSRLDLPANALSAPMRTYLMDIRSVIDQPINDVKSSCKPETEQIDCKAALRDAHKRNTEKCQDYDRNLNMYQKSRDFFGTRKFTEFINSIKAVRNNRDEIALSFFINIVLVESPDLVRNGRNLFRLRQNTSFPCSVARKST